MDDSEFIKTAGAKLQTTAQRALLSLLNSEKQFNESALCPPSGDIAHRDVGTHMPSKPGLMQAVNARAENWRIRTMAGLEIGEQKCTQPTWPSGELGAQAGAMGAGYKEHSYVWSQAVWPGTSMDSEES